MPTGLTHASPLWWRPSLTRSFLEIPLQHPTIHSIELQRLDSAGESGCIVELHLRSGELEIYAEPHLGLDEAWFRSDPPFAHFALGALLDTDFDHLNCDVSAESISASARFRDRRGDRLELVVTCNHDAGSDPIFIPAPVQDTPNNLRFLVANEFRMLPNRGSEVAISVDGTAYHPTPFLVPDRRVAPYLSARAGSDFLLVGLNPNHRVHRLPAVDGPIEEAGVRTTFRLDQSGAALVGVRAENDHAWIEAALRPGLPSLDEVAYGTEFFAGEIEFTSTLGRICRGSWRAWPADGDVVFELNGVKQDWSPGFGQPSRQALRVLRSWRRRNQAWTYRSRLSGSEGEWWSSGTWTTAA